MWLFVDFDGTLVDSLNVAHEVYRRFVTECGGTPDADEFRSLNGPSLPEIVETIARRCGLEQDHRELLTRYHGIWAHAYGAVEPKPGAGELLREARRRGLGTAVVTSASSAFVERTFARLGWASLIDYTISGDDVTRSKPDPASAQALEDSGNGVRAAAGAGITVVGLADGTPHSSSAEQLRQAGATRVIGGLGEFFEGKSS